MIICSYDNEGDLYNAKSQTVLISILGLWYLPRCHSPLHYFSIQGITNKFPGSSDGKEYACNAGDLGSIPGSGRSPGEGNGYPLQHSCLKNSMDRGAWQATVHGIAKSWTKLTLSLFKAKPCLLAMVFKLFF